MSEFDSDGKGGKPRGGSSFWDHVKTVGAGILEGMSGGAVPSSNTKGGGRSGVKRKFDRTDPVANERKVAVEQVHRSLKAWRDRQAAEGDAIQRKPQIPSSGGNPLPGGVKSKMETKLGANLSQVKIHTGGESEKASEDLSAKAFTVGDDIHFNSGQFDPSSKEGEKLLAHELTHVVQGQKGGVQRKEEEGEADAEGADGEAMEVSDPDEPAEKEADEVAEKVVDDHHATPEESAGAVNTKLQDGAIHRAEDDRAEADLPAFCSTGQNKRSFKKFPASLQALFKNGTLAEADFTAIKAMDDAGRSSVATLLGKGTVIVELYKRMDADGKTALASAPDVATLISDATDRTREIRRTRIETMSNRAALLDWRTQVANRPKNFTGAIATTTEYTSLTEGGFRPDGAAKAQGRTNDELEANLEEERPGGWNKYYWDFLKGAEYKSLHYNQNETTKDTFDVKIKPGRSNGGK